MEDPFKVLEGKVEQRLQQMKLEIKAEVCDELSELLQARAAALRNKKDKEPYPHPMS